MASYECFTGVVVNDGEIYIMEAGENCRRGLDVRSYGMKLIKQGTYFSVGLNFSMLTAVILRVPVQRATSLAQYRDTYVIYAGWPEQ